MWPLSNIQPYLVSDGQRLAGSLLPFTVSRCFLYHCLNFYMAKAGASGVSTRLMGLFLSLKPHMALSLGQICHSQGLEVALADLGLSAVLLSSDSWDGGIRCFTGPQKPSSGCGLIFLHVPWPSEIPLGPSAHASMIIGLQRWGGTQPATGSPELSPP